MTFQRRKQLKELPQDPLFGLNKEFKEDPNPNKVNLGLGIITDEKGEVYSFECLEGITEGAFDKGYLPIEGDPRFKKRFEELFYPFADQNNIVSVQSVGGTQANSLAAILFNRLGLKKIHFPNPTWSNHVNIFEEAGLDVEKIDYYDFELNRLKADFMESVSELPERSILSLDVCGHNPTGVDLSSEEIDELVKIGRKKEFTYFIDGAYVGLINDSIAKDTELAKKLYESGNPVAIAFSFSKNMSFYGQRLGVLTLFNVGDERSKLESNLSKIIRSTISTPPRYASDIALQVFDDAALYGSWIEEMGKIRRALQEMRSGLASNLYGRRISFAAHITNQKGLFSLIPELNTDALRSEHSIYVPKGGRINISGLKPSNLNKVVDAIVATSG